MAVHDDERGRRGALWETIKGLGQASVPAATLRSLGISGGAQGIWVDKARTGRLAANGVTVGLLHTGRHYPDYVSEDGLIYHYPNTARPPARDFAEVEATKNAARLGLPYNGFRVLRFSCWRVPRCS